MAIKLTNPVDVLLNEPAAFLIYGEPGVGKSSLAGSAPSPVIIACPVNETTSLARLPDATQIKVIGVETWADIMQAVGAVKRRQPELGDFKSVVFDNLTTAYSLALNQAIVDQKSEVISKATWPAANRLFSQMFDTLLTVANVNMIFVAHARYIPITETSTRVGPDFGDVLAKRLAGKVNAMFYYRMKGVNRELLTSAIPGIEVKSRYELPRELTNPTWDGIVALLDTYKAKIKEQHKGTNS